jgi:hypothetical protein
MYNTLYQTCIYRYNCLPEGEPSGSKQGEDIKKLNINLEKMHFVGLYFIKYRPLGRTNVRRPTIKCGQVTGKTQG